MIRVNVICEGQTEEEFVKSLLYHHLIPAGIFVNPIGLRRGDKYDKFRSNILLVLKQDQSAYLTSMIDLYGMGEEFPGYEGSQHLPPLDRVEVVERAIQADVARFVTESHRFIPYVQLHEFEALLFSAPDVMENVLRMDRPIPEGTFSAIRDQFASPEHINDNRTTAPSKRILRVSSSYNKPNDGNFIAMEIGLAVMRRECKHFNDWLTKLEGLAG